MHTKLETNKHLFSSKYKYIEGFHIPLSSIGHSKNILKEFFNWNNKATDICQSQWAEKIHRILGGVLDKVVAALNIFTNIHSSNVAIQL